MEKKKLKELLKKCNWNDITIAKYNKIKEKIETISNSDTDSVLDVMSVIYEMERQTLLELDVSVFNRLLNKVITLGTFDANKLKKVYAINGREYSIGMKYDIFKGDFDVTTDQYLSVMNILRGQNSDCLATILAVILIPKGRKFNKDYDLQQLKEDIYNHFSIVDAASIIFFLRRLFLILLKGRLKE